MKKEAIPSLFALFFAQSFLSPILYFVFSFLSLFTHDWVGGAMMFSLYALIWWGIWLILSEKTGISHFYLKLISATIPLLVYTGIYIRLHPVPTNETMIALLPEDIHFEFSTAVTGTLLFPLYSIALQRYVLPQNRTWSRFVGSATCLLVIGTVIFTSCYHFLPWNW